MLRCSRRKAARRDWRLLRQGRWPIFSIREGNQTRFAMLQQVSRIIRAFHIPSVEDQERDYLNHAASRYDLEMRQREVDGGLFRRSARYYY